MDSLKLIPILNSQQHYTQISFAFQVVTNEDKDLWDNYEELVDFIKASHRRYCKRYTAQEVISESVRIVDAEKLATDLLTEIENSEDGPARIQIQFTIQNHNGDTYFVKEYAQYSIHWYETPAADKIVLYFPVGFQTFHNFTLDKNGMMSSVILDLRVLNKEIEHSLSFFKDVSLPGLTPYLKYITDVYENISGGQKVTLDMGIIQERLEEVITTFYEQRLADPASNIRQTVFFNAFYTGDKPENARVSFHILADIWETSTPGLFVGHPDYKAELIKEREIIQSYGLQAIHKEVIEDDAVNLG